MMMKMQYSEYIKKFQNEVVKFALKAYDDRVSADESGTRPFYRPRHGKLKKEQLKSRERKMISIKQEVMMQ